MDFLFLLGSQMSDTIVINSKRFTLKDLEKGKAKFLVSRLVEVDDASQTDKNVVVKGKKQPIVEAVLNLLIKDLKVEDDATVNKGKRFYYLDYKEKVDDIVDKMIKSLNKIFGAQKMGGGSASIIGVRLGTQFMSGGKLKEFSKETLKFRIIKESQGGVIPTAIQESGTTIIFNQVLRHNTEYKDKDAIMKHPDTSKSLRRVFGSYEDRLIDWTHTYFEQQQAFLSKYKSVKWDEFEYEGDNFVKFFKKVASGINEKFKPLKPAGTYETWNPSDIWAVYDKPKVQKEIKEELGKKKNMKSLIELNALLTNLFVKNQLVGISLKKISPDRTFKKGSVTIKLVNLDTTNLKIAQIEKYKKSDIFFEINNIFTDKVITNTVKYGVAADYKLLVIKAGSRSSSTNLSFNTSIKATPGAQGGQAPVKYVLEAMGNTTFTNDNKFYPKSCSEFTSNSSKYTIEKHYKLWYNFLKPYFKQPKDFDHFRNYMYDLFKTEPFIAQSKLMTLHFFYETLRIHNTDPEFWTDVLYLGLKVGDRFAPHSKIS